VIDSDFLKILRKMVKKGFCVDLDFEKEKRR
jgi:hypothetical protein